MLGLKIIVCFLFVLPLKLNIKILFAKDILWILWEINHYSYKNFEIEQIIVQKIVKKKCDKKSIGIKKIFLEISKFRYK